MRFHKTGHLIAYLRLGTRLSLWPGESHLNQVYPEAFTGLVPLEHVYFDEHSILLQTTHAAASPGNTGTFKQACYPHYDDIFESTYGRVHIESRGRQSRPELHPHNRPGVFLGFTTLKHTYGAVMLSGYSLIVAHSNVAIYENLMPYHQNTLFSSPVCRAGIRLR